MIYQSFGRCMFALKLDHFCPVIAWVSQFFNSFGFMVFINEISFTWVNCISNYYLGCETGIFTQVKVKIYQSRFAFNCIIITIFYQLIRHWVADYKVISEQIKDLLLFFLIIEVYCSLTCLHVYSYATCFHKFYFVRIIVKSRIKLILILTRFKLNQLLIINWL